MKNHEEEIRKIIIAKCDIRGEPLIQEILKDAINCCKSLKEPLDKFLNRDRQLYCEVVADIQGKDDQVEHNLLDIFLILDNQIERILNNDHRSDFIYGILFCSDLDKVSAALQWIGVLKHLYEDHEYLPYCYTLFTYPEKRKQEDICIESIKEWSESTRYIDDSLKDRKDFLLKLIKNSHDNSMCFSKSLYEKHIDDKEFAIAAINTRKDFFRFLSPRLREDEDVVNFAVDRGYENLLYASDKFRYNTEFVLNICESNPDSIDNVIKCASGKIQLICIHYGERKVEALRAIVQLEKMGINTSLNDVLGNVDVIQYRDSIVLEGKLQEELEIKDEPKKKLKI